MAFWTKLSAGKTSSASPRTELVCATAFMLSAGIYCQVMKKCLQHNVPFFSFFFFYKSIMEGNLLLPIEKLKMKLQCVSVSVCPDQVQYCWSLVWLSGQMKVVVHSALWPRGWSFFCSHGCSFSLVTLAILHNFCCWHYWDYSEWIIDVECLCLNTPEKCSADVHQTTTALIPTSASNQCLRITDCSLTPQQSNPGRKGCGLWAV